MKLLFIWGCQRLVYWSSTPNRRRESISGMGKASGQDKCGGYMYLLDTGDFVPTNAIAHNADGLPRAVQRGISHFVELYSRQLHAIELSGMLSHRTYVGRFAEL